MAASAGRLPLPGQATAAMPVARRLIVDGLISYSWPRWRLPMPETKLAERCSAVCWVLI